MWWLLCMMAPPRQRITSFVLVLIPLLNPSLLLQRLLPSPHFQAPCLYLCSHVYCSAGPCSTLGQQPWLCQQNDPVHSQYNLECELAWELQADICVKLKAQENGDRGGERVWGAALHRQLDSTALLISSQAGIQLAFCFVYNTIDICCNACPGPTTQNTFGMDKPISVPYAPGVVLGNATDPSTMVGACMV